VSFVRSGSGDGPSLKNGCTHTAIRRGDLRIPERRMLFCLSSATPWDRAGVTHATAQRLLVRGLIDRDQSARRFKLTPLGRDVLAALLKPPVDEQDG
jgi:hypothetical protein